MWRQTDFLFLHSKIPVDSDCSHEIKRLLLLGWKYMTNPHRMLKSRDITLPTKVHIIKAMASPVIMYVCESWSIEKAEHQRIDAFCLWCWRRLLRVSWTARKSNQSILKEIRPKYSLEGLFVQFWSSNTLATWCEESTRWKRMMVGNTEGKRRREWQRMRSLDSITDSMDMNLGKLRDSGGQRSLAYYSSWSPKE